MSHTKGPWRVSEGRYIKQSFTDIGLSSDAGAMIATVPGGSRSGPFFIENDEEVEANALLIAAAPELLEALQERIDNDEQSAFEDWLRITCPSGDIESVQRQWEESSLYSDFLDDTAKARAAIAKATGEPQ